MRTGTIRYNIHDRGRQHRGQPRNFDSAALAAVINSPATQERVKNRDLVGYLGHWPRVLFGMNPGEGGPHPQTGRHVRLEPTHTTVMLRCDSAGNVEHEAEFLDTPPGRSAQRWFANKTGGFSSAIACDPETARRGRDVPVGFYGFDYVSEPNYATNRGFVLDGVEEVDKTAMLLDSVIESEQSLIATYDGIYAALQNDYKSMSEAMNRVTRENEELMSLIMQFGDEKVARAKAAIAKLDGIYARPAVRRPGGLEALAEEFKTMPLERREELPKEANATAEAEARRLNSMLRQFGRHR